MKSAYETKYLLLPNYDDNNSVILLGDDGSRKIIKIIGGRLVIQTVYDAKQGARL